MYIKVYKVFSPLNTTPFAMYLPNQLHAMPYRNTRKLFVNFNLSSDAYVAI